MGRSISLVFPHQLFDQHPALEKGRLVVLVEDTLLFGDPHARPGRFHKQKIMLHRATMKAFEERLEGLGYEVLYLEYDRRKTIEDWLFELDCQESLHEVVLVGALFVEVVADGVDALVGSLLWRMAELIGTQVQSL